MGGIGKGGIFSFHMPFFFILSGMTSHFSKNRDEFIKRIINSFVHLIIPALILYFLTILYSVRNRFELLTNKNYLREILYTILFASGSLTRFNNITINSIGIPWFFFVLYFGKIIFENQKNYKKYQYDIGSITTGPYAVALPVSDHLDKTRAWYEKQIDLNDLEVGKYTIYIANASNISDVAEFKDLLNRQLHLSKKIGTKIYTFMLNSQNNNIELIVEK